MARRDLRQVSFADGLVNQRAGRNSWMSAIREHLKGQTQALKDLAIELLARGLSVRDIEDAFLSFR